MRCTTELTAVIQSCYSFAAPSSLARLPVYIQTTLARLFFLSELPCDEQLHRDSAFALTQRKRQKNFVSEALACLITAD